MSKNVKEMNIVSLIFVAIYIMRYRFNLIERLMYLCAGALVIYLIWSIFFNKKFEYSHILPSMMFYIAIDQIIYYI